MGQTEQTNKWHTFVLESEADSAYIKLGNHLDFEKITQYTLTVRVQVSFAYYIIYFIYFRLHSKMFINIFNVFRIIII